MQGVFFVTNMDHIAREKRTDTWFKEYMKRERGIEKNEETYICACKGTKGNHETTGIRLKDFLNENIQNFYIGITENSKTMKEGKWEVYTLDKNKMKKRFEKRYANELNGKDLSELIQNNSGKNYRINVGPDNIDDMKEG